MPFAFPFPIIVRLILFSPAIPAVYSIHIIGLAGHCQRFHIIQFFAVILHFIRCHFSFARQFQAPFARFRILLPLFAIINWHFIYMRWPGIFRFNFIYLVFINFRPLLLLLLDNCCVTNAITSLLIDYCWLVLLYYVYSGSRPPGCRQFPPYRHNSDFPQSGMRFQLAGNN